MELKLVRSLWGINQPWEVSFPRIKAAGYSLIEHNSPVWSEADERRFVDLAARHGLGIVLMGITQGATMAEHLADFRTHLENGRRMGAAQMTLHSGRDSFTDGEVDAFYREVAEIEKDYSFAVAHETHRGRVFNTPWRTRDVLRKFPSLKLCCDFSHWCCVAERLDWDDSAGSIVSLCAERAVHVHTRVGYEQGPQVPDPAAPEYAAHLERHFEWWQTIWRAQSARGMTASTFTPEFGPPGYLHTLPHTNVPVADLWNVCEWMKAEVVRRFSA